MSTYLIVVIILFVHWFADFVLQTSWEAENKSKSIGALLSHTTNYSMIWLLPIVVILFAENKSLNLALPFIGITFICHTITDFITSKVNAKLYKSVKWYEDNPKGKVLSNVYRKIRASEFRHKFFVSIGFDQWLHQLQLILTYWYLTK